MQTLAFKRILKNSTKPNTILYLNLHSPSALLTWSFSKPFHFQNFGFFVSLWTVFTDKHEILFYTTTFFLIRNAEYEKTLTLNVHEKSWRKTEIRMFQPHKFNQWTGFNPWRKALDLRIHILEAVTKLQGRKYQRDSKGMVIKLRLPCRSL